MDEHPMDEQDTSPDIPTSTVIRDVVVLQFKLIVDGLRDVVLVPVSLFAALWDVFDTSHKPGYHFYRVARLGKETERFIGLFEAADRVNPVRPDRFGLEGRSLDELIRTVEEEFDKELAKDEAAKAKVRERLEKALDRLRRKD